MPFSSARQIFGVDLLQVGAAVILQGADGRDDHHRRRTQSRLAALDVDELLGAEIRSESRLRDHIVGELQRRRGGQHGIAAMGDVRERPAVNEGRIVLERLHQVRLQGLLEQHGHRALRVQILGANWRKIAAVADHDVAQPLLQVLEVEREAEDRHDFGGDHDVEAVLARKTVAGTAQSDRDVAQGAVVHVHHPLPCDSPHIEAQLVTVVNVVVDQGREQVVREPDGAEIAGEVQIDVFHRHDLGEAAAGRAALHAENGPEARFAQADDGFLADLVQRVAEAHGGRGLALAGGRGTQRRHEDQLAVGLVLEARDVIERYLRLVMAVVLDARGRNPETRSNLGNGFHGRALGNLYIGTHF